MSTIDWTTPRYETGEALARIESVLGDKAPEGAQDWDLEAARPERFEALVEAYATHDWNEDERFALASLLFATLDERLHTDVPIAPEVLAHFEFLMVRDVHTNAHKIEYWAMSDEPDPDNVFRATAVARRIRAVAEKRTL